MPKVGLSSDEWKRRLKSYAQGTFSFGRGQRPTKNSKWDTEIVKIERCPKHGRPSVKDAFGRIFTCSCGYHKDDQHVSNVPVKPAIARHDQPSASSRGQATIFSHVQTTTTTSRVQPTTHTRVQTTTSSRDQATVSSRDQATASSRDQATASSRDQATASIHVQSIASGRDQATASTRDQTTPSRRDQAKASSRDQAKASSRDQATASRRDQATTSSRDQATASSREQATASSCDQATASSRDQATASSRDQATASSREQATASSCDQATASSRDQATASSRDQATASSREQAKASSCDLATTTTYDQITASTHVEPVPSSRIEETDPSAHSSNQTQNMPALMSSLIQRQVTDYGSRLPLGWDQNITACDRNWIGRALFIAKGKLTNVLTNWWYPPPQKIDIQATPTPLTYFQRRMFLWMPRRMWLFDLACPNCTPRRSLRSKGLYNRVRLVLDITDYYYLAGEYMDCSGCHGTFISWDQRILNQLPESTRVRFPCVLTHKYACDNAVISLLRSRTEGNSPTALQNNLQELHSEEWLKKQLAYLSDCERHKRGLMMLNLQGSYQESPAFKSLPTAKWFLASYVRDVWSRHSYLQAAITSVYGRIIKIDSSKKVLKKLQGAAANTASWITNVGNERGEILQSVLTASESAESMQMLADGLMNRYDLAGENHPVLLYTDRDCCNAQGPSKYKSLFVKWKELEVRLDIWHFMRRLANGCTTESHPLYGTFMHQLSLCIFEWDSSDYELLVSAKRNELKLAGISHPSDTAVRKAISKDELAKHCRRRTRGAEKTTQLIEELLLSLATATDTLGVHLLKKEMSTIWTEQKRHISCIQDLPSVPLYTVTNSIQKGGVKLPVLRCARGSTSLESFHLHLARFIPGTSASAVNFQAYLLDGITRWNAARSSAALHSSTIPTLRTFDVRLQDKVNQLSLKIHGSEVFPNYKPPAKYTGESIGVQYLYSQSGLSFFADDLDQQIDEGFEEDDFQDSGNIDKHTEDETLTLPESESESGSDSDLSEDESDDEALDAHGIPGWDKVDALAKALISLTGLVVTNSQARDIQRLYDALLDYDKRPLVYKPRVFKAPRGRFARSKGQSGHVSVDAVKRCFLSAGAPSLSPARSRLVETICIHLCDQITQASKETGPTGKCIFKSRWKLVLMEYTKVRARLLNSQQLLDRTNLVLFNINETTLTRWYKNNIRRDEIKTLLQGIQLPAAELVAHDPLPEPQSKPTSSTIDPSVDTYLFLEPEDRTN